VPSKKAPRIPSITQLVTPIDISDYAMKLPPGKDKAGGGGGGGERNPLPATKGRAPKFSMTQIAPPMVHTKPDSTFQATLLGPPDLKIPSPNMDNYGDPLAKLMNASGGPGGGSGIGSGTGTGIGSGKAAALGRVRAAGRAAVLIIRERAASAIHLASIALTRNIPKKPARQNIRARSCFRR
jgi:hypothetical protein